MRLGAEPVDARVVIDRNRITGAGVTAGADFGLTLVGKLRDQQHTEGVQLMAAMFVDFVTKAREAAKRSASRRG